MDAAIAELEQTRREHARQVSAAGGVEQALGPRIDTTVSEALVLGLLLQGVRTFFCVFGHGSTEIGEVLRHRQQQTTTIYAKVDFSSLRAIAPSWPGGVQ